MLSTRTLSRLSSISDFLNTAPGRRGGQPAEEALTAGTQLTTLVPQLSDGDSRLRVAAAALSRAKDLRTRLTAVWTQADVDAAEATEAVNALLAEVGPLRLVTAEDAVGFAPATTPSDAVERLAALAALALAEAAVEGELSRLRVCAGEDCENTLVDASRNRSKRFCDAANCANRTHVRSYRARLAGTEGEDAVPAAAAEKDGPSAAGKPEETPAAAASTQKSTGKKKDKAEKKPKDGKSEKEKKVKKDKKKEKKDAKKKAKAEKAAADA